MVDPRRDITVYLKEAENNGMTIVGCHRDAHPRRLPLRLQRAGGGNGEPLLSDEGNADWKYGFEGERLYDGDEIRVGNVTLRAIHTPGHTPEHLSFLVTDGATTDEPGFVLTGDFVFVGDLGGRTCSTRPPVGRTRAL